MADPDESRLRQDGTGGFERAGAILLEVAEACGGALIGLVEEQEKRLSEQAAAFGEATRAAARSLVASDNMAIARPVEEAADRFDGFARHLSERNWREIAAGTADFARRRPGLFGLAAVACGFFAGRLLAARADRDETGRRGLPADPGSASQSGDRLAPPGAIGSRDDGRNP